MQKSTEFSQGDFAGALEAGFLALDKSVSTGLWLKGKAAAHGTELFCGSTATVVLIIGNRVYTVCV